MLDLRGRWLSANAAASALLGYAPEELLATTLRGVTHTEDYIAECPRLIAVLEGVSPGYAVEKRLVLRDGTEARVHQTVSLSCDGSGKPVHLVWHAVEVGDLRSTASRMRDVERLSHLATLASAVAHDVSNPLTYVMGNAELVSKALSAIAARTGGEEPEQTSVSGQLVELLSSMDKLHDGARRIRQTVRALRTFALVGDPERARVDVRAVLDATIAPFARGGRDAPRVEPDYGDLPPVHANAAELSQVFTTLVSDVVRSFPDGARTIVVRARPDGRGGATVEIRARDPGSDALAFEPCFTTWPPSTGTGIGLFVCQSTVERLGGEIEVSTARGRGTAFRVSLPGQPARGRRAAG